MPTGQYNFDFEMRHAKAEIDQYFERHRVPIARRRLFWSACRAWRWTGEEALDMACQLVRRNAWRCD